MAPVQTPVEGRGTATNNAKPSMLYFFTFLAFLSVLFISQVSNFLTTVTLLNLLKKGFKKNNKKGTGIMLPTIHRRAACMGFIPNDMATGIAPLSSITGKADIKNTLTSLDKKSNMSIVIPPKSFSFLFTSNYKIYNLTYLNFL